MTTIRRRRTAFAWGALGAGLALVLAGAAACKKNAGGPAGAPLPDSAYRLEWLSATVPATMKAGSTATVQVTVKNASDQTWPDPKAADPAATGAYAVRLAWRWRTGDDMDPGEGTSNRTDLPRPLAPGETVQLSIDVTAPKQTGPHTLQLDLVQELVAWFESYGAPKQLSQVTVE